ncbi:MAG: bacteriohopanetetrol glucosamine biosynthesis glycosyltransferase HpnI [Candidatus Binataceae bacterium]
MIVLVWLSATGVAVSLAYYLVATVIALRFARGVAVPLPALPKIPPKIAVLKPLHGRSDSLGQNLISYLETDYPRAEFIFGVESYEDPAAGVPVALRPPYQFANILMVVGEEPGCANRKVAKLIRMAERSEKAEIFVLSDADVRVDRDHLRRVVAELLTRDELGIVTCMYRALPAGGLASHLEALFVNTDFVPMVLTSAAIEPLRHAMGATIAIKRKTLEAIGGFRVVKDVLADDFHIGRIAAERGFDIRISSSIVTDVCEERTLGDFWNHQLRWSRTYRNVRPISLATICIHGPFWALMLMIATGASTASLAAFLAILAARLTMSALLLSRVLSLPTLRRDLWLVPLKDLIMTAIWFASLWSNRVLWAGRRFEVLRGGGMRELSS